MVAIAFREMKLRHKPTLHCVKSWLAKYMNSDIVFRLLVPLEVIRNAITYKYGQI